MNYALEHKDEFARLEEQSLKDAYDFRRELADLNVKKSGVILDAGCGSGIVTRYLANRFSDSTVVGCDFSDLRIEQAKNAASHLSNVSFFQQDLTRTDFPSDHFDTIVCRYVMEHLNPVQQRAALSEMKRCLKPGGQLWIIDVDGFFYNIYPQTEILSELLAMVEKSTVFDFKIGRKLPFLLNQTGFSQIEWLIDPMQFHGRSLDDEIQMLEQRFSQANEVLVKIFGNQSIKDMFVRNYIDCLKQPHAVLFYSKFIVKATKSKLRLILE